MLVHHRVTPSIKFASTHLYTWVERGTVRVKCLAREHNRMSPARAWTRTPETSALTMKSPRLHQFVNYNSVISVDDSDYFLLITLWQWGSNYRRKIYKIKLAERMKRLAGKSGIPGHRVPWKNNESGWKIRDVSGKHVVVHFLFHSKPCFPKHGNHNCVFHLAV